jgi:pilus assembly protein CpaF
MEGNVITMQDIFVFEREGINEQGVVLGRYKPTGIRPKFTERLEQAGIHLPVELFED